MYHPWQVRYLVLPGAQDWMLTLVTNTVIQVGSEVWTRVLVTALAELVVY